jgi:ribokinase
MSREHRRSPLEPANGLVVVVGSVNADVVLRVERLPRPGETLLAEGLQLHPGGKGANQAVAAARLGADVAFIGAVGSDDPADLVLSGMKEAGVDLRGLAIFPEPTGQAFIMVDSSGANSIVVASGANQRVDASLVLRHTELLLEAAVLVLQGEVPTEAMEAAAAGSPARLVLNLAPVVPISRDIILRADPLVVNEHEGPLVLSLLGIEDVDGGEEAVALALFAAGVTSVVMTLGGAGDAFVGALSARLAAGSPLDEAVTLAVRVGSYAVGRLGAQASYPRLTDITSEEIS